MGPEMIGLPPLRLELDAACRKLPALGRRGEGGAKSTMDDVAAEFAKGERKSMVLRVEKLDPGRDGGSCGRGRS